MKYCTKCGAQNDDVDNFCGSCGTPLEPAAAASGATATADVKDNAPVQTNAVGAKGKIAATRDKALGFERKHSVIVNALIAVCAIVIMFVALFAPIKVMGYELWLVEDDKETAHMTEIDQTIWDMFDAVGYISLDSKDLDDIIKRGIIEKEYHDAIYSYSARTPEDIAENLSEMNYMAYLMAHYGGSFSDLFSSRCGGSAFITVMLGLIVAAISLAIAVISGIYLIFAIVGVAKKKTYKGLFKYLGTVMGLSVTSLALYSFAPFGKAGGGMLGVFVFAAVMMLVLGVCYSLIMGKNGIVQTIKKGTISLVLLIATCLLFTNTMQVDVARSDLDMVCNVPFGNGVYSLFAAIGESSDSSLSLALGGAIVAVFAVSIIACAGASLNSSLKSLVGINKAGSDKTSFINAIMMVIMSVIAIVFAFVGGPLIVKAMNDLLEVPDPTALVRAQVYVAAVLFFAAAIVMKAFAPADKPFIDAPETQAATANEATIESITSVEDVKEPDVDDNAEAPANDDLSGL